jgi:sulfite reductase beta subunit-like hemoprotein
MAAPNLVNVSSVLGKSLGIALTTIISGCVNSCF